MKNSLYYWGYALFPIILLLAAGPWLNDLDLQASGYFYQQNQFQSSSATRFIFQYGIWPAWITIGICFGILITSCFLNSLKKWRKGVIFLILTLGIGSGLIVHAVLKDHWGRPRPKQTIEFGGSQPFRAFYEPNFLQQPEPSKSFPSGHASVGFFFCAVALLGWHYRHRTLFYTGILLFIFLGGILSWTRVAQGGHYLSDTLFSAAIMWLTAFTLYRFIFAKYSLGNYKKDDLQNS